MPRFTSGVAVVCLALMCAAAVLPGCKGRSGPADAASTVLDITPPAGTAEFAPQPPTRDPREIVARMVRTFQAHPTLFVSQSSDIVTNLEPQGTYHQACTFQYSRDPFAMVVKIQDPARGTHEVWAGNREIVYYTGANLFTRDQVNAERVMAQPGPADYVRVINAHAWGLLSPVDLVVVRGLPPGVVNPRLKGEDVRGGRACHVVSADVDRATASGFSERLFGQRLPLSRAQVTMWIDKETYVLRRTDVDLAWQGQAAISDKAVIRNPFRTSQTNWVMVAAPRYTDGQLRFVPPKGSDQVVPKR